MQNSRLIAVIGLAPDEVEIVKKNIPQKDCEIIDTEDVRDIIIGVIATLCAKIY